MVGQSLAQSESLAVSVTILEPPMSMETKLMVKLPRSVAMVIREYPVPLGAELTTLGVGVGVLVAAGEDEALGVGLGVGVGVGLGDSSTVGVGEGLARFNLGKILSFWTKRGTNWKVIFREEFGIKSEALKREKWLKSGIGRQYLKEVLK